MFFPKKCKEKKYYKKIQTKKNDKNIKYKKKTNIKKIFFKNT